MFWKQIVFLLALCICARSEMQPTESYTHWATLESGNIMLYWKFNDTHITFEVHGETTGWIGIGFSPTGGMKGADIVIGWVKNGTIKVTDRHGTGSTFPPLDPNQDINVLEGAECDGWTMFKFSRQLAACEDDYDREISQNTQRLIWAYEDGDPAGDDLDKTNYHGQFRGAESMYFLESADKPRGDLPAGPVYKTLDILAANFTVPTEETYYNCRLFKIPDVGKKHHVVKFEPMIQEGNEIFVHHILIYQCGDNPKNESEINVDGKCFSSNMPHSDTCTTIIMAWAIGGGYTIYPEKAGFSIGDEGDPIYIQMEIHYDNPALASGLRDNSGLRLTYTDTLRKYDVGVLYVGNAVIPTQHFIPPGAKTYLNVGICFPECLEKGMDVSGIQNVTIFNVLLHSHLAGRSLRLRHFRDGEELPYITSDDTYDFKYQEARFIDPPVTLMPRDEMRMECVYNTEGRTEMTEGGFGTRQEMCISFVSYYPRMNTGVCSSSVSAFRSWPYFGIDLRQLSFNPGATTLKSLYLTGPDEMEGKSVMDVMNEYNWTEANIDKFSKDYLKMPKQSICVPLNRSDTTMIEVQTAVIKSEYDPPVANCSAPKSPLTQMESVMTCEAAMTTTTTTATLAAIAMNVTTDDIRATLGSTASPPQNTTSSVPSIRPKLLMLILPFTLSNFVFFRR